MYYCYATEDQKDGANLDCIICDLLFFLCQSGRALVILQEKFTYFLQGNKQFYIWHKLKICILLYFHLFAF